MAGAIRVGSLDTHQAERDAHLRSADFFDVERYPEIVFESISVELPAVFGCGLLVRPR